MYGLPPFLRAYSWVDCRDGLSDPMIDRLVWGITGRKPHTAEDTIDIPTDETGAMQVRSKVIMRGKQIPYRVFKKGGHKHYLVRIFLDAKQTVLDTVIEIEYQLHWTFKQPRRVSTDRVKQFSIDVWTYAGFDIHAIVRFEDGVVANISHAIALNLPDNNGSNYVNESKATKLTR